MCKEFVFRDDAGEGWGAHQIFSVVSIVVVEKNRDVPSSP